MRLLQRGRFRDLKWEANGVSEKAKSISESKSRRIERVKNKATYPVVDLFAGPGGLGEGFASMTCPSASGRYAFRTAISVEKEEYAHTTLKLRHFFREFAPNRVPDEYYDYLAGSISKDDLFDTYAAQAAAADKSAWKCTLGEEPHNNVKKRIASNINGHDRWVLVGGPPCQAYSLVGRSRMKGNPQFESDPRHFLYREYLRTIADHKPPVFVMENVKGLLSAKIQDEHVINLILRDLSEPGKAAPGRNTGVTYNLYSLSDRGLKGLDTDPGSFVVQAEDYGIPQARHRIFIMGVRSDIDIQPQTLSKTSSVSVREAISDLPVIRSGLSKSEDSYDAWRGIIADIMYQPWYLKGKTNGMAVLAEEAEKTLQLLNSYRLMEKSSTKYRVRSSVAKWFRDDRLKVLSSHESRSHMDSDVQRYFYAALYASVNGVSPKLVDFPIGLLPQHKNVKLGMKGKMFSDRFRVQLPNTPATTITSHISKDGHYFIHYDPMQCRSLTVREAARLQTFPDNYKFEGPRTAQYQQVGNAVPPLLANQIAQIIYEILGGIRQA